MRYIDIRHLDCQPLLESPDIEDNLLAILCHIEGHEREVVRRILYRIAQVSSKERRDLWEQLLILTGLRSIQVQELVKQEGQKMPITVDMGETIWGKELFEQEERRGEALILQRQLTKRFGSLPQWAVEKIAQAQNEQLEQWSLQLLEAETLEAVFAQIE